MHITFAHTSFTLALTLTRHCTGSLEVGTHLQHFDDEEVDAVVARYVRFTVLEFGGGMTSRVRSRVIPRNKCLESKIYKYR